MDLSSLKAKLKSMVDAVQSRYTEVPADISRRLQHVQLSLRKEEDKVTVKKTEKKRLDLCSSCLL